MSILDVIGDIGTVYGAINAADQQRQDREYQLAQRAQAEARAKIQAEMDQANLEDMRRKKQMSDRLRQVMSEGIMTDAQPAREINVPLPTQVDDEGNQMPAATRTAAAVPGRWNQIETAKKAARVAQEAGDWKTADEFEKRAKVFREEGLQELASDLMGGRDPVEAVRDFNSKGIYKINEGAAQFDPATKTLRYTDEQGQRIQFDPRAFLKNQPKDTVLSEGQILTRDGQVIASNPRNRSAEEDAKLERQKKLEEYKFQLKARQDKGDPKATAEIQNINFIAQNLFGGDVAKAIEYKMSANGKTRTAVVRDMMALVKDDFNLTTPEAKLKKAEEMADALISRDSGSRAGVKATATPPKATTKTPQATATDGGQKYEKIDGQWYPVN